MYYIYTNRFQPLNILNEQEIKWLAANIDVSDKIIIGIVNPVPTEQEAATAGDLHDIWIRGAVKYNPLTFWQRYLMIKNFVENNDDLKEKVEAIIPHARPSTNMAEARKYLPNKYIECLSTPQQNDEEYIKRKGLESQSETIFEIPSHKFGAKYTLITPELICCLIAVGSDEWRRFVSNETKVYLDSLRINELVCNNLRKNDAKGILKKIYNRESDQEEQRILFTIVRKYVKDISYPELLTMDQGDDEIDADCKEFLNKVYSLAEKINEKLGQMQVYSPNLYPKMQKTHDELYNLADDVKEGHKTLKEGEQLYTSLLNTWKSRRG